MMYPTIYSNLYRHSDTMTSVTVHRVSEVTGLSLDSILEALDWSKLRVGVYHDNLTANELSFLSRKYFGALKNLQKRTYARRDRTNPAELEEYRSFFDRFVTFDEYLYSTGDSLKANLDEEKVIGYFYSLVYGIKNEDNDLASWVQSKIRLEDSSNITLSICAPVINFRSHHYHTYPDEDGSSVYKHQVNTPLHM